MNLNFPFVCNVFQSWNEKKKTKQNENRESSERLNVSVFISGSRFMVDLKCYGNECECSWMAKQKKSTYA